MRTSPSPIRSAIHQPLATNIADSREISGAMSVLVALLVAMFLYPFNITLQFLFYASVALVSLVLWEEHKKSWDIEEKPLLSLAASLGFIVGLVLALAGVYFMVASYISDIKYASALGQKDNDQLRKTGANKK